MEDNVNSDRRMDKANITWIAVKITWAIYCLFYLKDICKATLFTDGSSIEDFFGLFFILFLWFATGILFCLLQMKYRNLKWWIMIHICLTSLVFTYYAPFYSLLL